MYYIQAVLCMIIKKQSCLTCTRLLSFLPLDVSMFCQWSQIKVFPAETRENPSQRLRSGGLSWRSSFPETRLFSDGSVLQTVWSQSDFTSKASSGSWSLTHTVLTNVDQECLIQDSIWSPDDALLGLGWRKGVKMRF